MRKYGTLNDSSREGLTEKVNIVLEFLKNTTEELTESLEVAPGIVLNPISFVTKVEQECLFEAHKRLYDVHIILSGEERILVSPIESLKIVTPYNSADDIMFLEGDTEKEYILKADDWLVCLPEDAHKVGMAPNDECVPIKKIVAKITV